MSSPGNNRPLVMTTDFPAKIVELLARPVLSDLPENPVGKTQERLRTVYADSPRSASVRSTPRISTRFTRPKFCSLAMLRYGIDDIRKIESAQVA